MKTQELKGVSCCICGDPATEYAAQNTPYCARHAASNRDATRQMQERATSAAIDGAIRRAADERLINEAVIVGHEAILAATGTRRQIVRHWQRMIALADDKYVATSHGAVAFIPLGHPRYAEFEAAATGEWPED
jgi:hypothetical protein